MTKDTWIVLLIAALIGSTISFILTVRSVQKRYETALWELFDENFELTRKLMKATDLASEPPSSKRANPAGPSNTTKGKGKA